MNSASVVAAIVLALVLSWAAPWFPGFAVPPAALAVALLTVRRGRTVGAAAGSGLGFGLDLYGSAAGPWILALVATAVVVDRLHRETLTHHTPFSDAILAAAATGTALVVAWVAGHLTALSGTPIPPAAVPVFARLLLLGLVEAALLGFIFRVLRRVSGAILARFFYARRSV